MKDRTHTFTNSSPKRRAGSRWFGLSIAVLGAATLPAIALANEPLTYGCVLTGQQEVPPVASSAIGGGQLLIDVAANTLSYRIAFTGLTSAETMAHIHGFSDPGAPAGVVHPLPAGNPKVGVWNYADADEPGILAGRTYVNIHSANFGGGEIRGQIVPLNASLSGAQEVPPVATAATGWGTFTINTAANQLNYYIAFAGLSSAETAAHIHGFVLHAVPAGVVHPLPAGTPKIGTWNYAEADEGDILDGRTYVNIHSANFGGGEIRGQIVPTVTPIDGNQENPDVPSTGAGIGLFAIDRDTDVLSYDIRFAGIATGETAAHIHGFAPPEMPAGVLHPLPAGSPKIGSWNYGAGNEASLLDGLAYVNVHSNAFPNGEIRGQIEHLPGSKVASVEELAAPHVVPLLHSAPNPFGPQTGISFRLSRDTEVALMLFDVEGRLVRALAIGPLPAGEHTIPWDGRDDAGRSVASGLYYGVLETPAGKTAARLTRLR